MEHTIKKCLCDYCPYPSVAKEVRKLFPTLINEDGTFVPNFRTHPDFESYTETSQILHNEAHQAAIKPCLCYEADCHGDEVAICLEHLKGLVVELEQSS